MKKKAGFSIFTRLTLAYFCTLFFIYCIMMWLLIMNTNATRNDFLKSRHLQAQAYIENFERQLDAFYTQESYLVANQAARRLAYSLYKGEYEKYQLILSLIRALDDIESLSPLIEDAIIYLPAQEIKISSVSGYGKEIYNDADYFAGQTSTGGLVEKNGRLTMQLSYPLMYSLSKEYMPDMVITIFLSESAIKESLDIFSDDSGSGAMLIYNRNLVIGNVDDSVVSEYLSYNKEETIYQIKAVHESYKIDTVSASEYPLELLLSINNRTLTQIIVQNIILLTIVTMLASVIFLITIFFTRKLIHKPLSEMVSAFEKLREGRFDVRISHKANDEFNFIYGEFNDTVEKLRQLIEKTLEQDKLINAAELAQLQSQINPHFLYNSFFIISRMAKNEEYEQISAFVTSLARYYRFLNKIQQDAIPLKDEVEHMNNYIDIQQLRFGDKICVEKDDIPKDMEDTLVPKLILQPLIENAYEYGLKDKLEDGLIRISYACGDGCFDISIEDNGECTEEAISKTTERLSGIDDNEKSHALYNINRRLKLSNGPLSGIVIEKSVLGGFKVCLHILDPSAVSRIDE